MTQKAEAFLAKKPEITQMITTVGQASGDFGGTQATAYKSEINVRLVDRKDREDISSIYATKVGRELAKQLPGVKVKTVPISIMGIAENAPIDMVVMGSDLDSVMKYAEAAKKVLATIPGSAEIKLSVEKGSPEINVQVDSDKMAALGLSLQTVGATMQTAFSGNTDGKFRKGEYEYDINIRYDAFNRKSIEDVQNLIFINNAGEQVKLSQFADIKEGSGPSQLERRDKSTSVSVKAQSIGRPTGTIVSEFQSKLEQLEKDGKLQKPVGVSYLWAGDQENQSEGFGTLGIALLASIILVYLIMVALYDSFVYPFVVMFSIPLSIIGALLALALNQ